LRLSVWPASLTWKTTTAFSKFNFASKSINIDDS
jgi:hypothetical protein